MFERYTERARRVIFFSRYEASQFGSTTIETEHLLLGLLREDTNLVKRFLKDSSSTDSIRNEIASRMAVLPKVATSIDLPLSTAGQRVLHYAFEEAERLANRYIGTEHLLLGLLREEESPASEILRAKGFDLSAIREQMAKMTVLVDPTSEFYVSPNLPHSGCVPDTETAMRVAEAVWIPMYGYEFVNSRKPFRADLVNDVWTVEGPLPLDEVGRTLVVLISKVDCRILRMGPD